jgi:hypothetical protein
MPYFYHANELLLSLSKLTDFFHVCSVESPLVDTMNAITDYLDEIDCTRQFECAKAQKSTDSAEFGALPVATRCWADYEPSIDSSSAFSCTPSDTCRVGTLDYGATIDEFGDLLQDENQIVCDSCPMQPGGLVNQFGCDAYTKQCTCNRWEPIRMHLGKLTYTLPNPSPAHITNPQPRHPSPILKKNTTLRTP